MTACLLQMEKWHRKMHCCSYCCGMCVVLRYYSYCCGMVVVLRYYSYCCGMCVVLHFYSYCCGLYVILHCYSYCCICVWLCIIILIAACCPALLFLLLQYVLPCPLDAVHPCHLFCFRVPTWRRPGRCKLNWKNEDWVWNWPQYNVLCTKRVSLHSSLSC